jgi:hypothetical protein
LRKGSQLNAHTSRAPLKKGSRILENFFVLRKKHCSGAPCNTIQRNKEKQENYQALIQQKAFLCVREPCPGLTCLE